MVKLKILIILFLLAGIISCGKNDEDKISEDNGDKTDQLIEKKEEPKENSKEETADSNKVNKNSNSDNSESKELKFYTGREKPEAVISAIEASSYIGKVVIVKGFVADVYKTERVAYLNFIEKFPKNPFSGVIFANKFDTFGDLNIYEGKNIELTGRVTVYKEKPQIILESKEQIKISE